MPMPMPMPIARPNKTVPARSAEQKAVNLERYVPAYLTWIANKLSSGASQQYLKIFDVGIETWRCMVLLKVEGAISAQHISRVIGMDKASISRCFKSMQEKGLVRIGLDAADGRMRLATLTKKGRQLHDDIVGVALERERALLAVLTFQEQEMLIGLLRRLHENLPEVEQATQRYVEKNLTPHGPPPPPESNTHREPANENPARQNRQ